MSLRLAAHVSVLTGLTTGFVTLALGLTPFPACIMGCLAAACLMHGLIGA